MILRELLALMRIHVDEGSVKRADAAIAGLAERMKQALEVAGVVELGRAVKSAFDGIAETATGLRRLAQETGMGTDALQELRYAAKQTGVDTGDLEMGLVHLARSAQEAATIGGPAATAFRDLGVSFRDGLLKLRPLGAIFGDLAEKFRTMPDGPAKTALSMQLLSRTGEKLIPLMNGGTAGIEKWGVEARRTGGIMSESLIRRGEELHHSMNRLDFALRGVAYAVASPLVKALTEGKNSLVEWIEANRRVISTGILKFVGALGQAFQGAMMVTRAFGRELLAIGAAMLAIEAPVLAAGAALAFFFADLRRHAEGKDSLIGRILYKLKTLSGELEKDGGPFSFLSEVFKTAHDAAKDFFEYVEGKVPKSDAAAAKQRAHARLVGGAAVGGFLGFPLAGAAIGYASAGGAMAGQQVPDEQPWFSNFLRNFSAPGFASFGYAPFISPGVMPGAMAGAAAGVTINIDVTAAPGVDGHQIGKEIGDSLVKHRELQEMLNRAAPK